MREHSDPERDSAADSGHEMQQDEDGGYSYGGFRREPEPPPHGGYAEQGFGAGEQGSTWGGGARGGYGGGRPGDEYGSGGWRADLRDQDQLNPAWGERGAPRAGEPRESHWRGGGTWSGYTPRGGARESPHRGGVPERMGPDPGAAAGQAERESRERAQARSGREHGWAGSNRQSASRGTSVSARAEEQRSDAASPPWPYLEPWAVPGPFTGVGPEGYRRPEQSILEEVCERLTRHGELDARGISVQVEGNEVILEGTVDSRSSKRLAEDTAASVSGVRDVHNRLRLRDTD